MAASPPQGLGLGQLLDLCSKFVFLLARCGELQVAHIKRGHNTIADALAAQRRPFTLLATGILKLAICDSIRQSPGERVGLSTRVFTDAAFDKQTGAFAGIFICMSSTKSLHYCYKCGKGREQAALSAWDVGAVGGSLGEGGLVREYLPVCS